MMKLKRFVSCFLSSGEKAYPCAGSVERVFSLAFAVFYDIGAYSTVFLFRDLGSISKAPFSDILDKMEGVFCL